jgi:hypothetical protein
MRCGIALILLAVVLAPSLGDFAARPGASACRVAPCCAGKSASCPMHHPSGNTGMRSCSPSERDATLTVALAILRAPETMIANRTVSDTATSAAIALDDRSTPPPTPPPQRGGQALLPVALAA